MSDVNANSRVPIIATLLLGVVGTLFCGGFAYVYFINDWATLAFALGTLLIGVPAIISLCILGAKRRIRWKTLAYFAPLWALIWISLARPYGILNVLQVKEAKTLFFAPSDAQRVELISPRRHSRAIVAQSYYSQLTRDELLAFYSNRVTSAGMTIIGTRTNQMQVTGAFYPWSEMSYRSTKGRYCGVMIYENVPYDGLQHTRCVRQEVGFSSALGPPMVGL